VTDITLCPHDSNRTVITMVNTTTRELREQQGIYSASQAARMLRVSRPTILRMIARGDIKATRLHQGGDWRIAKSEIDAFEID
jgi:excisionase family DNA binding protein